MGVSMHRDSKSGIWVLQWGGRKNRQYLWTGKRDRHAAKILRERKEQELALRETGDLELRIAETVAAKFEKTIEKFVELKLRAAMAEQSRLLAATGGRPLPDLSIEQAISKYVEAQKAAGNSKMHVENVERQLRKFTGHAGVTRIYDLHPEHLTKWLADTRAKEGLGDKRVSDRHQIVTKWLAWLPEQKALPPKRAARRKVDYFTAEEYRQILARAAKERNPRAQVLATLALFGGFRAEELFVMDHKDIRLEERVIEVGQGEKTTKTRTARTIPIFDQMLKPLLTLRGGKGRVFAGWKDKWAFGAYFQRLIKRATKRDNAGLLIARHSAHTWLIHAGVNLGKVASWMGNSPRVIERNYLGRVPDAAEPVRFTYLSHSLEPGGLPRVQRSAAAK
jgi:site-specific recombinase XerC